MRVTPIACLKDNYAYLLVCPETKEAAIIDASEAGPVLTELEKRQSSRDVSREDVKVVAILSTHHHWDHVGGNEELKAKLGVSRVYGQARKEVKGQTHTLEDGDTFQIGALHVRVIGIPGHTLDAIAYVVTREPEDPIVFTGDTLFVAGCGRIFEGDPPMMHASLQKLAALDPRTRVYCGHEYTESNLRFAASVEPSNHAIEQARAKASATRAEGKPTVPSTIEDERAINPFLRVTSPEIRAKLGIAPSAKAEEALGAIRAAKDSFK